MRTGVGIAIPLPGELAESLGLRAGTKVRIEGPDAEGTIRITPVGAADAQPPLTAADVVRAITRTGPIGRSGDGAAGITQELEHLVERHADVLREVES